MKQERRTSIDRRRAPTPHPFKYYTFLGRRMKARRRDEDKDYYVDQYETFYLFLVLGIILFCLLDAFLTLGLIGRGGHELNPLMSNLIQQNATLFLALKIYLTFVCVLFLLIHKNFRLFGQLKTNYIIYIIFSLYVLLIIYELHLYISY